MSNIFIYEFSDFNPILKIGFLSRFAHFFLRFMILVSLVSKIVCE